MEILKLKRDAKLKRQHTYSICFRGARTFKKDNFCELVIYTPNFVNEHKPLLTNILFTQALAFKDLTDNDCNDNYDETAQTKEGLLEAMKSGYDCFNEREIVTLVFFEIVNR